MTTYKKRIFIILALIIFIVYLFPVYWMITSSIRPGRELLSKPLKVWPSSFDISSYIKVFERNFLRYLKNSFILAGSTSILTMILASLATYGIVRLKVRWTDWILLLCLLAQMLPAVLMATPLFIIFDKIGLLNNYLAVIIANITKTLPFAIIMLESVFLQVPEELEEAALIDGCTPLGALVRVTFPLAKGGIFVVAVISFIFAFNDFIYSLSFLYKERLQPLNVGIYTFIQANTFNWNEIMAYATLTIIPLIVIFILLQNQIIKGLTAGALK